MWNRFQTAGTSAAAAAVDTQQQPQPFTRLHLFLARVAARTLSLSPGLSDFRPGPGMRTCNRGWNQLLVGLTLKSRDRAVCAAFSRRVGFGAPPVCASPPSPSRAPRKSPSGPTWITGRRSGLIAPVARERRRARGDKTTTHIAMLNCSSHFFFSSLVLKKNSKPLWPWLCVR